jgi:hypothetical protein
MSAPEIEIREGRGCGPQRDHILLHLEHLEPRLLRSSSSPGHRTVLYRRR